jgi:hypothetical protein
MLQTHGIYNVFTVTNPSFNDGASLVTVQCTCAVPAPNKYPGPTPIPTTMHGRTCGAHASLTPPPPIIVRASCASPFSRHWRNKSFYRPEHIFFKKKIRCGKSYCSEVMDKNCHEPLRKKKVNLRLNLHPIRSERPFSVDQAPSFEDDKSATWVKARPAGNATN